MELDQEEMALGSTPRSAFADAGDAVRRGDLRGDRTSVFYPRDVRIHWWIASRERN